MPGCFGRRKKKNKDAARHEPKDANSYHHGNNDRTTSAPAATASAAAELDRTKLPQQKPATPKQQQQSQAKVQPQEEREEADEVITVTRSHSVQHAAPKAGNIKKAATMSRYDFLRKQENLNYADRWAALKQRYLAPVSEAATDGPDFVKPEAGEAAPNSVGTRNGPKSPIRATVQSLPRKFSPPSTVVSPVKFSNWFYERKTRESQARQEFHDREERMRKIIEGPSSDEMEEAAVKIQAGYKGYKTRKEVRARRESQGEEPAADGEQDEQHAHVDGTAENDAAAPAEEIDPNDSELTEAAARIQAGFSEETEEHAEEHQAEAGHDEKPEPAADAEEDTPAPAAAEEAEAEAAADHPTGEEGIDLNDPEQNEAAAKIQAGFRGLRARREVAEMRKQHEADHAEAAEDAAGEAAGDAAEDAAGDDAGDAVGEVVDTAVEEETEEAKPEAEPEAEPQAEPEAEPQAEPEAEPEADTKADAEPEIEAEPAAEAEAEHAEEHPDEPEAPAEAEAEAEAEADAEAGGAEAEETAAAPAGEHEEKSPDAGGADAGEAGEEPEAS